MRQIVNKKGIIAFVLILTFGIQGWFGINYLIVSNDRIENFYLSSDDLYSQFINSETKNDAKTFFKTDNFSINFNYITYGNIHDKRVYYIEIFDENDKLIFHDSRSAKSNFEHIVNLTDFYLNPEIFTKIENYKVRLTVLIERLGWTIVGETIEADFKLEKEVVDITSYYIDEIYLQTRSSSYHHEIKTFVMVQEAGENEYVKNLPVDIFWMESNGEFTLIDTVVTNETGQIFFAFEKDITISEEKMKLIAKSHETDIYKNRSSEEKTHLWSNSENNRHIVMNGAEIAKESWGEYSEGSPNVIYLTNKDHHIYSPNGEDSDVENYNFTMNPFGSTNSFGLSIDSSHQDGYDYQLIDRNGIIHSDKQEFTYQGYQSSNFEEYWKQNSLPEKVVASIGSINENAELNYLSNNDNMGLTVNFGSKHQWNGQITPVCEIISIFDITKIPIEQLLNLSIVLNIDFPTVNVFDSISIKYLDKYNQNRTLVSYQNHNSNVLNINFPIPLKFLALHDEIQIIISIENPTQSISNLLLDQLNLIPSFNSTAIRRIAWNEAENYVQFEAIGGVAHNQPDNSRISLGCEVYIPKIPNYNLSSVTINPTFSIRSLSNFQIPQAEFKMLINPSSTLITKEHILGSINHLNNSNSISNLYNITDDLISSSNPITNEQLFYLSFEFSSSNLITTDIIIVYLEELIITGIFKKIDSMVSNIEIFNEEVLQQNGGFLPTNISYNYENTPIEQELILNEQIPYYYGSKDYSYSGLFIENGSFNPNNQMLLSTTTNIYPINNLDSLIPIDIPSPNIKFNNSWYNSKMDYNNFEISYSETTNILYISNETGMRTGREYSLNNRSGMLLYQSDRFYLGYNIRTLINFDIPQIKNGICNVSLIINFSLDSSFDIDSYQFTYRRVKTPQSWSTSELQAYYTMNDMNGIYWIGDRSNPIQININRTDFLYEINITDVYKYAVYNEGSHNLTLMFDYYSGNMSNILETKDLLNSSKSDIMISSNYIKYKSYSHYDIEFKFVDSKFLLFDQKMVLSYSTQNIEGFNLLYYDVNGSLQTLINVSNSSDTSTIEINLFRSYSLFTSSFFLRVQPIFKNTTNVYMTPKIILKELRMEYQLCKAIINFTIESEAQGPFQLRLLMNQYGSINYGYLMILKEDGNVTIIDDLVSYNYGILKSYYISTTDMIEFADYRNITLILYYYSSTEAQIELEEIYFSVALTALHQLLSSYSNNRAFDFDTIITLNRIIVDWDDSHGGKIEFYIKYGIRSNELVNSQLYYLMPGNHTVLLNGIICRFIELYYIIYPENVYSTFSPTLEKVKFEAERTVSGTIQSLYNYNDQNEYIWAFKDNTNNSVFFDFVVDSSRKTDAMVLLVADYFEFTAYGIYATNLVDNVFFSMWNFTSSNWVILKDIVEKRSENTIEAIVFNNMIDFCNSNGLVKIMIQYNTNYLVNLHIDFIQLVYFSNIRDLIGIDYFYHLDLPRASKLIDLLPSDICNFEQTYTQYGRNTTQSYTPQEYDTSKIKITRILTDYALGNINTFISNPSHDTGSQTYNNVAYAKQGLISVDYKNVRTGSGSSVFSKSIRIQVPSECSSSCSITFSASLNVYRSFHYWFFGTTIYANRANEDLVCIKLSSSSPQDNEWKTKNEKFILDTTSATIETEGSNKYLRVYCFGKNVIEWWEALAIDECSELTLQTLDYSLRIASINTGQITIQKQIDIEIPINAPSGFKEDYQFRGLLISGTITANFEKSGSLGLGTDVNANIRRYDYKIQMSRGENSAPIWDTILDKNDIIIPLSTGNHADVFTFTLGSPTNCYSNNYIIQKGSSLILKLRVNIKYVFTSIKLSQLNWDNSGEDNLNIAFSLSSSSFTIVPLISSELFSGNYSYTDTYSKFDFTSIYKFNKQEIIDEGINLNVDNDWYFGTHIGYSIFPCWQRSPTRFDSFDNSLEYKIDLKIYKKIDGLGQWFNVDLTDGSGWKEVTIVDSVLFGKNELKLILAETEDRASINDPNAIRLGASSLDDYFIDGELNIKITLIVRFKANTVNKFEQYRNNDKKQIIVTFDAYTQIDIMTDPVYTNNLCHFNNSFNIPTPENSNLVGKLSFLEVNLGGTISLISAELIHFQASGLGMRWGIITPESGKEVFGQYKLFGSPSISFYDSVMIPFSKLEGKSSVVLFMEIGYWNGRFIGLYDDCGVVKLHLDYLKFKWVYSTGFLDISAGKAYVDKVIDISFGYSLPENITNIIISSKMEGILQGLVEDENNELQRVFSVIQPIIRIYNWATESFDYMDVYVLGGNKYQFVLDEYLAGNIDNYHVNGQVKLLIVLDGRSVSQSSTYRNEMYYAKLVIDELKCEFSINNSFNDKGTYCKIKPNLDIIIEEGWEFPELIFKKDIYLSGITQISNGIVSFNITFDERYSEGLYPYNLKVMGANLPLNFTIQNCITNGTLIKSALLKVLIPNLDVLKKFHNCIKGISVYWNMINVNITISNSSLIGSVYNSVITQSNLISYYKYLPYSGDPSNSISDLWQMDFGLYSFSDNSNEYLLNTIFDIETQSDFNPSNITSFEVHCAISTNDSISWAIGIFDLNTNVFNWYSISDIYCHELYFKTIKTSNYILPFSRADFNRYYSDQGLMYIKLRFTSLNSRNVDVKINLFELQLNFNETAETLANQTYLEYIVDDTFLDSLDFWDTFDRVELGTEYLFDDEDFEIYNGYLTKKVIKRDFWDWLLFWWIPQYSPSYLLLNDTKNKRDYYANFKFNIQNTGNGYKSVSWLIHSNEYYSIFTGYQITGLLFRLQAYESSSSNKNKLEIWRKSNGGCYWNLYTTVSLPMIVHTQQWYDMIVYVNGSHYELWLNGTRFYDNAISINNNQGYFGLYSYYSRESFIDNLIISKTFPSFGGFQDHFAKLNVELLGNYLRYGDTINVSITPMPGYNKTLSDQKINLMVNSSDGWLYYENFLTNNLGQGQFSINNVDLYTKNILSNDYPTLLDKQIVSNTTQYYLQETFNGKYSTSWTSNYINDFDLSKSVLEKKGPDRNTYLLANPSNLPSNYTFEFQACMNDYSGLEKFEWIIDSNSNFNDAYIYRLYSATSSEDPNILRLYKVSSGSWNTIAEIVLNDEVIIGDWTKITMKKSEDTTMIYHKVYMNGELIFSYECLKSSYTNRPYLGFRIYGYNQARFDNVSIYTGSVEWENVPRTSYLLQNNSFNYQYYNNVKFNVDKVTHVESLMLSSKEYDILGNNTVSLELNMSFPNLLNDYNQQFNLDKYYGLRVGVLVPYDEIIQSIVTYVVDFAGNKHEVILEGANLAKIYDHPNLKMIFIDGHRLIHTYIDIGLQNTWNGSLTNVRLLGVQANRKSYNIGEYNNYHAENIIGICSLQFIRQINDFSYNNYNFDIEPKSQIAVWYQGEGPFYSSFKIFDNIYFTRLSSIMNLHYNGQFILDFGSSLNINLDLKYDTSHYVPILSLINPASFLLILEKNNKKGYGGIEVVRGNVYNLINYQNYLLELRTFVEAGTYTNCEILWFGNGLFKPSKGVIAQSIIIKPQPTTIELVGNNLKFDFGYAANFEGYVFDRNHEILKDQEGSVYFEDFSKSYKSIIGTNVNPNFKISRNNNLTIKGEFTQNEYLIISNNTLTPLNLDVNFVNLFTFKYWVSDVNVKFIVQFNYSINNGMYIRNKIREFTPNSPNTSIKAFIDTQLNDEDLGLGPSVLIGYSLKIVANANIENIEIMIEDISLNHAPWVYLQIKGIDGKWYNLTGSIIEPDDETESKFSLPLFTKDKQFILNNPYLSNPFGITRNGTIASGDYKLRVWYSGCDVYYQDSYADLFIRVKPLPTAIYFVPDNITGPTRDGYFKEREYNSTTIFALEEGKPFTLLDIGYTWGDLKNLTFLLSTPTGGFNGIPNKPIWFQIGIVPATINGLKDRDYFADYYPVVRNVKTGQLLEQPYVYQGKYQKPILYDYFDISEGKIKYYSAYIWAVNFTNNEGYVTFNLDFGVNLIEDLRTIFPGFIVNDINKDLYIRVFYSNNFRINDMVLEVEDKYTGEGFICTKSENARKPNNIFTFNDTVTLQALLGGKTTYYDPIYEKCYAEGIIDIRREDLAIEGRNFEVTCTGNESDVIPLEAQIYETSKLETMEIVKEGIPTGEYNKFNILQGTFIIMDSMSGEIVIGDPNNASIPQLVTTINPTTGLMNATMQSSIMAKILPGFYDVLAIVSDSEYYFSTQTTFTMLVKSAYTFDFMSPTDLFSFNQEMDEKSIPFRYNSTGSKVYDYEQDFIYPTLKGNLWMEDNVSMDSDGVGVYITLNKYPIFDQIISPYDGIIPFEMSLEFFKDFDQLILNISVYNREEALGREPESEFEGNNVADWLFMNASIFVPTQFNPTEGVEEYNLLSRYNTLLRTYSNTYTNADPARQVQIRNSIPFDSSFATPGLLIYPTTNNEIPTSVELILVNAPRSKPTYMTLNTNGGVNNEEELLEGFVFEGLGFNSSIRHSFIALKGAPNDSDLKGSIMISADPLKKGLEFPNVYCPFEGFFETLLYAPDIPTNPSIEVYVAVKLNGNILKFTTLTSAQNFIRMEAMISPEYYSTYNNIEFEVWTNSLETIKVFLINSNMTGFEDVLFCSDMMPSGRAGLFSSRFLYYYLWDASAVNLNKSLINNVWLRIENAPGQNNTVQNQPYNLEQYMKIFPHVPATSMSGYESITTANTQRYDFQPNKGIFIRNILQGFEGVIEPEIHSGYISMYNEGSNGNINLSQLINRRKVTVIVNPYTWTTKPSWKHLRWLTGGYASYYLSLNASLFNYSAKKSEAHLFYNQKPYSNDLVFERWDAWSFKDYWNKTSTSTMNWDYWYNEVVFSTAILTNTSSSSNVLDFYPGKAINTPVDWRNYNELVLNFAVNDSNLINKLRIELVNQGITYSQEFNVKSNASTNYYFNLTGLTLNSVTQIKFIGIRNSSNLGNTQQCVFISSEGVALSHPEHQIRLKLKYDGFEYISSRIPRDYFGINTPFKFDLNMQYGTVNFPNNQITLELIGTPNSEIDLKDFTIYEYNNDSSDENDYILNSPHVLHSTDFDSQRTKIQNMYRFLSGEKPINVNWINNNSNYLSILDELDSYSKTIYTDFDLNGVYDRAESFQDFDQMGFDNGIGDYHAIDEQNDGEFEKVISHDMKLQQQPVNDGSGVEKIIHQIQIIESVSETITTELGKYQMVQEYTIFRTEQNGEWLPEIRTITYSLSYGDNPRPSLIVENRDEWRLSSGQEDFEIHKVSKWNDTTKEFMIKEWNDWEVTIPVVFMGKKTETMIVKGILDKGINTVKLDPVAPIQDNDVTGTILWTCSYDTPEGELPLFYDTGLVLIDNSAISPNAFQSASREKEIVDYVRQNYRVCVGIILDINRDHIWQQEKTSSDNGGSSCVDVYCPIWEVSELGRTFLKQMAQDKAWADWLESYSKGETYAQMIASIVVSVAVTMLVSFILGSFLGPLGMCIAGFVGSLAASLITQYVVSPIISMIYDYEGYEKNKRITENQKNLMKTRAPAPTLKADLTQPDGKVAPDNVFNHYKALYEGYQVPIMGSFTDTPLNPNNFVAENGYPKVTVVNAKIWMFERESIEFMGVGDILSMVWKYIQNPFGVINLIKGEIEVGIYGEEYYQNQQYDAFYDQKSTIIEAYKEVFGYNKLENVSVVIYPVRQNGQPMYVAVKDDFQKIGVSNFWNFSNGIIKIADINMMLYAAKYQNFYSTDWRTTAANVAVMLIQMIAQMGLTQLGTKFVSGKFSWGKNLKPGAEKMGFKDKIAGRLGNSNFLDELCQEIFVEEFFIHSLGGFLTNQINLGTEWTQKLFGFTVNIEDYLPFGWDLGDALEWSFSLFQTRQGYIETRTRLAMSYEVDTEYNQDQFDKLPELCQEIVKKATNDKVSYEALKNEVKTKDAQKFWNENKKFFRKVYYAEFETNMQISEKKISKKCEEIVKNKIISNPDVTGFEILQTLYKDLTDGQEPILKKSSSFYLSLETRSGKEYILSMEKGKISIELEGEVVYDLTKTRFIDIVTDMNIKKIGIIDPSIEIGRSETGLAQISRIQKSKRSTILDINPNNLESRTKFIVPGTVIANTDITNWLINNNLIDRNELNLLNSGTGISPDTVTKLNKLGIRQPYELNYLVERDIPVELVKKFTYGNRHRVRFIIECVEDIKKEMLVNPSQIQLNDFNEWLIYAKSSDEFVSKIIGKNAQERGYLGRIVESYFEYLSAEDTLQDLLSNRIPNRLSFTSLEGQFKNGKRFIDTAVLFHGIIVLINDAKFSYSGVNTVKQMIYRDFFKFKDYMSNTQANIFTFSMTRESIDDFVQLKNNNPNEFNDILSYMQKVSMIQNLQYDYVKTDNDWIGMRLVGQLNGQDVEIWFESSRTRQEIEMESLDLFCRILNYEFPGMYNAWKPDFQTILQFCRPQ